MGKRGLLEFILEKKTRYDRLKEDGDFRQQYVDYFRRTGEFTLTFFNKKSKTDENLW